ncbi:methyltransferase domain-containing protein [Fomes fomentarius]|nr:methyltransferase domain-containing protein [Fomes fomentarius]
MQIDVMLQEILDLIRHPLVRTIYAIHPNDLGTLSFDPPIEWREWWDWAGNCDSDLGIEEQQHLETPKADSKHLWLNVLHYYDSRSTSSVPRRTYGELIPPALRSLINDTCKFSLPRDVGRRLATGDSRSDYTAIPSGQGASTHSLPGMSPKKAHEVLEMARFIQALLPSTPLSGNIKHAVDIGAGQAYLSRMLRDNLGMHVLALDWSEIQIQGAARKDAPKASRLSQRNNKSKSHPIAQLHPQDHGPPSSGGSLTYVSAQIEEKSLLSSINAWMGCGGEHSVASATSRTPVLFVALHACGSLTPDILRAFVTAWRDHTISSSASWTPQGAVVVGCCYNMMRSADFPLSRVFRACRGADGFTLSPNHLQLAAQVPGQWIQSEESLQEAKLAMRKVVWRALVEDELRKVEQDGKHARRSTATASEPNARTARPRLGRLNDAVYADWDTFISTVRGKLGVNAKTVARPDARIERRIEVFHTLRCILGPVVESLILLDRLAWVQEELQGLPFVVELVNLFDQATGSGRNVAIVIRPVLEHAQASQM